MDARPWKPFPRPRVARARTVVWVAGTGAVGGLALAPLWATQRLLYVMNLAVALSLAAAAAILWDESEHRATAVALEVAALLWSANWLNEWRVGPLPLLSTLDGPLPFLVAGWALLRFPRRWLREGHERALVAVLAAVELCALPEIFTSQPEWHDFRPDAAWWTVWPDRSAFHAASTGYQIVTVVAFAGFGALFLTRMSRLRGPDLRAALPVAWATAAACAASAVTGLAWLVSSSETTKYLFSDVEGAVIVGLPVALMVTVVRRRLDGETSARLAARLGERPDGQAVRDAARDALRDPGARIWYWIPDYGTWVDSDGHPGSPAEADGFVHEIRGAGGERLAILTGDASLARHRPLVEATTRAIALALANVRLQAAIRAETHRVAVSAERVERVLGVEQRRVERAITDGVQRRLLSLDERLDRLVAGTTDDGVRDALAEARRQLGASRRELDLLAAGQVPPVLAREGLPAAVATIASGLPVPLDVDVPAGRLDGELERAIYFVIAEAVSNAVKHARASRITVRVTPGAAGVEVVVSDDGRGGADLSGHGLRGVERRVRALGGEVCVESPPGAGTRVRAGLPNPAGPGPA